MSWSSEDRSPSGSSAKKIEGSARSGEPSNTRADGNLTSQHFANFYLEGLDHYVLGRIRPRGYVRYKDDMVLFGADKGMLRKAEQLVAEYLAVNLRLELKSSATLLAPVQSDGTRCSKLCYARRI